MRFRFAGIGLSVGRGGLGEGGGQVGVEEAVEEVLAGFAADAEAAGYVGAGVEAALDGVADGHVFVLNDFAHGDAFAIVFFGGGADVAEIVVENDGAFVGAKGKDEVGVHHSFVGVDHEIGIDPEVEGAALARGADFGICVGVGGERAGLQAGALEIFDGVFGVFDDAAEAFVGVGDGVAAVAIVIDVDLPIAIQRVDAAVEVVKFFCELEGRD